MECDRDDVARLRNQGSRINHLVPGVFVVVVERERVVRTCSRSDGDWIRRHRRGAVAGRFETHLAAINGRVVVGDERLVRVVRVWGQAGEVGRESIARAGACNLRVGAARGGLPLEALSRDGHVVGIRDGGVQRGGGLRDSVSSCGGYSRIGEDGAVAVRGEGCKRV